MRKQTQVEKTNTVKKLARLYGGHLAVPKPTDSYINISSKVLTEDEKCFLNLGINCHFYPKYSQIDKKVNISLLYDDICSLQNQGKVTVNPGLQSQLQAECTKKRHQNVNGLLSSQMRDAAKQLRNCQEIVIRKADKAATYVILDRDNYMEKCRTILNDDTKFEVITKNPIEQLKKRVNQLIDAANAVSGDIKFQRVIGDYEPGYFYGNVKAHKQGNPLRPIISQIPTPTYKLAKQLNDVIAPYIPRTYSLRSTDEFIDTLKIKNPNGILASLDVSSLFTNVPLDQTIEIILQYVYNNNSMAPIRTPRNILREMLSACTKEAPFKSPEGILYRQKDGVAMGSPVGVLFAEAYMAHIGDIVLQDI